MKRLSELDQDFRRYRYELLDLIDEEDEDALEKEQADLDNHDDVIDDTNVRAHQLITVSSSSANLSKRNTFSRRQSR